MTTTKTNPNQTGVKEMKTKAQMIEADKNHASDIANGFICRWVQDNPEEARKGNIPKLPTDEAFRMFEEECYPKYSIRAFLGQWTSDREELLS